MLAERWRVHCNLDRGSLQPIGASPERRTSVKGIAAMGAGCRFPSLDQHG